MPRRQSQLFDSFANFEALRAAAKRAVRGKRRKPGASAFIANLEKEILRLERELRDGSYRPGEYMTIRVRDPKERIVSAAPFRDRVVHHALCATIQPVFERGFIDNSFANRTGKGAHKAIEAYERYRDRHRFRVARRHLPLFSGYRPSGPEGRLSAPYRMPAHPGVDGRHRRRLERAGASRASFSRRRPFRAAPAAARTCRSEISRANSSRTFISTGSIIS